MKTPQKTLIHKQIKSALNIAFTASYALLGIVAEMKAAIERTKQKKKGGFYEQ